MPPPPPPIDLPAAKKDGFQIRIMSAAELAAADIRVEWLIDQTFVRDQPMVVAGPEKSLKTGTLQDAAISLCTGVLFLETFQVTRKCKVLFMSGESGDAAIKNTFERICKNKGIALKDVDGLFYTSDIPSIEDSSQLAVFEDVLKTYRPDVCMVDPFYFCIDGKDAGSLFVQGAKLAALNNICKKYGVTLVICHHFNNGDKNNKFRKPTLQDISWAGFKQFARQWWLLGRRKEFQEGSGVHELHFVVGGSAGHSYHRELEIREGNLDVGRIWLPFVFPLGSSKKSEHGKLVQDFKSKILEAFEEFPDCTETENGIRDYLKARKPEFNEAFDELVAESQLVATTMQKGRKKNEPAFRKVPQ